MKQEFWYNSSWYNLEERVFVVTGATRGIGLEIAKNLIVQGARVVICGRKEAGIDTAVKELGAGDNVMGIQAHVAREDDVERLFNATMDRFGRLDGLVNNVGMNLLTPSTSETDLGQWNKIIETNLTGAFLCSRKAATIMKKQGHGKIVNISSIAGRKASPGMGVYGIAKAGIEMLTRVLGSELAPFNIQVNAVAPGMVRTDFSRPFWSNEDILEQIVKTIPLGRIAEPIDIVHPVLFLCSDAANYITGHVLVVDGGATIV